MAESVGQNNKMRLHSFKQISSKPDRALLPVKTRITKILAALKQAYPNARCSLNFSNPIELLVATILSAQCLDTLVNKVTAGLFRKYRTASDYAQTKLEALEHDVSRVNFYRNKAKHIQQSCRLLVERFDSKVPRRMEELLQLSGVARKTANVVLANAYGVTAGIVVDTHVLRVSQRLGLTSETDRDKIERELMELIPQVCWIQFAHQMIAHGRSVCTAKTPQCTTCPIGKPFCPSYHT